MSAVVIGVDQGTTGTRAIAFDERLNPVAEAYRRVSSAHPRPGWVEKDADKIVASVEATLAEVVERCGGRQVAAVGLDNEGETVVAWEARSRRALAPAVVWSCRRSAAIAERLAAAGAGPRVEALAGTPLDPYFSSTKLRWLLEEDAAVREAARAGGLRLGTLDAYICARLGDGERSEPSTAARTQLQALAEPGRWSPELCEVFGIDPAALPPLGASAGDLGTLGGLPLRALLVDQTAALAGNGCISAGAVKATYGTGIFVLAHAGASPPASGALMPTVAWSIDGATDYALDGGVFSAGSLLDWLRDGPGLIADAAESEALARSVPDSGGVRFFPALTGAGAPWWRPSARGVWAGLTSATTRAHLVRAALESLCWRVRDIIEALPRRPEALRVDGGMTANRWLMQRQADVLGIPLRISPVAEATALGAAAVAGVGAGLWAFDELDRLAGTGETVEPSAESAAWRDEGHAAWRAFATAAAEL